MICTNLSCFEFGVLATDAFVPLLRWSRGLEENWVFDFHVSHLAGLSCPEDIPLAETAWVFSR